MVQVRYAIFWPAIRLLRSMRTPKARGVADHETACIPLFANVAHTLTVR